MRDAPAPDELEISLFGPAYGEAIAVHYGDGQWFCVDSCLEADTGRPASLSYLQGIGVDLSRQVSHVALTHTDGDHVRGISRLFEACSDAQLVVPFALDDRHAIAYLASYCEPMSPKLSVGTKEIVQLLRTHGSRKGGKAIHYASQDRPVFATAASRLTALAPDDVSFRKFIESVVPHIPEAGSAGRQPPKLKPNHSSVVFLLETLGASFLFGADLEEEPGKGWTRVVENSVQFRAANNFRVYKVAHHGSRGAHCEDLWRTLDQPISILAPFDYGRHKIPGKEESKLIIDRSSQSYSTSSFKTKTAKRASTVDRQLRLHRIRRSSAFPSSGHIRYRMSPDGTEKVELFGGATKLAQVS
ncbi:MBL fold metallo-hydrolase [Ruegeria conchae]|uniref:Uncharacterized protein n=1 Tax=Ruegeria conchae TaxID=981384 RepID=A0A497ZFD0_9RHOB|nr:MBL fold metallo-hydrolase [Ruegeria conchae]RLK07420.1 hypothetical protein CLV75_2543 [Ruegeria conchae]